MSQRLVPPLHWCPGLMWKKMNQIWRVFRDCSLPGNSFCGIFCKRTLVNLSQPHIYKKTWTEDELLQYLRKNVVYECDNTFITSLPMGMALQEKTEWWDHETSFISDIKVPDLARKLKLDFQSERCYAALYPGRCASGLTILTKNGQAVRYMKSNMTLNASKGNLILTFLAVVLGRPNQIFTQEFGLKERKSENGLSTEILDLSVANKKCKRINYQHEVLDSTEHVSLVKVDVSSNIHDGVRHILARRCFTPVLGDFWNIRRKQGSMFGIPLVKDIYIQNTEMSVLHPELLEKLQLQKDEEKFIPCHLHLLSLKLPLKNRTELFVSAAPSEFFVWACRQLGLNEIEKFTFKTTEKVEMSGAQD